jgi:hypothetical protein
MTNWHIKVVRKRSVLKRKFIEERFMANEFAITGFESKIYLC